VGFQKLSDLKSEVVPEATIDDRIVKDPVRAVDVDDRRCLPGFELSAVPNPNWIRSFLNQGTFQSVIGKELANFRFEINFTLSKPRSTKLRSSPAYSIGTSGMPNSIMRLSSRVPCKNRRCSGCCGLCAVCRRCGLCPSNLPVIAVPLIGILPDSPASSTAGLLRYSLTHCAPDQCSQRSSAWVRLVLRSFADFAIPFSMLPCPDFAPAKTSARGPYEALRGWR
jgi:hypothetical protein